MPDTLVGTDSHTTMINGLGVLGWGVGGIEAEAAMLGQPMFLPQPLVVGVRVTGALPPGTTATDLVLTLTADAARARRGRASSSSSSATGCRPFELADRATLSNMCPEYGATAAFFPVDDETLRYLRLTGRGDVRRPRGAVHEGAGPLPDRTTIPSPVFSEMLDLDLAAVEPTLAGPEAPAGSGRAPAVWRSFVEAFRDRGARSATDGGRAARSTREDSPTAARAGRHDRPGPRRRTVRRRVARRSRLRRDRGDHELHEHLEPSVMLAAGLLAKKAVEAGLESKPWVKTSLAPGSRVVTDYLDAAGLTPYLEKLGFDLVGYGCTTCIGNSGPLPDEVAPRGRRGRPGRRRGPVGKPQLRGAHPPAGAGQLPRVAAAVRGVRAGGHGRHRPDRRPARHRRRRAPGLPCATSGRAPEEVARADRDLGLDRASSSRSTRGSSTATSGGASLPVADGPMYEWDRASTYVREPPFFDD